MPVDGARLRQLLLALDPAELRRLGAGHVLRLVDDERLDWGSGGEADTLLDALPPEASADPVAWLQGHVAELIAAYYRTHPLTRRGFDRQVQALFARHGADAFAAPAGARPRFTLFVDGGTVVAEPRSAVRHRYGAHCELPASLPAVNAARQAQVWLDNGAAYDDYLGMNVCRYNC